MLTSSIRAWTARCALPALLLVAAACVPPAGAEPVSIQSAGVRAGLSISPDQFVFGGQLALNVAPQWTFDPSLELGYGGNESDITINFDALYHARLSDSDWRPYFGGGLQINEASIDEPAPFRDHTDTNLGLNGVIGFQLPGTSSYDWFGELRIGIGDVSNLKLMGGLNFKL